MKVTLEDNQGNKILSYDPNEKQWWITGFNPYYQGVQADNLIATFTIYFSGNIDMYYAFKKSLRPDETRWTFNSKDYSATLTF